MATNLKIAGNFLVLSDVDTGSETYRIPRSQSTFLYTTDGVDYFFTFQSLNNLRRDSEKLDFTEIIDDRTGSAFNDVEELQDFLSLNLGGVNQPIFSTKSKFCDYSKTATLTLPTAFTKLDYSGASLIDESEDLFDPTNSRIEGFAQDEVGMATISITIDGSGGGTHWVEFQLRGFDIDENQLFAKK